MNHKEGRFVVGAFTSLKREKGFPTVASIYIYEKFQRKGLGLALYRILIDTVGGVVSDASLTGEDGKGGSYILWKRLSKIYNPYIIYRKPIGVSINPVVDFTLNDMKDSTTRFMVTKEPLINPPK